jgi:hypothetical protein
MKFRILFGYHVQNYPHNVKFDPTMSKLCVECKENYRSHLVECPKCKVPLIADEAAFDRFRHEHEKRYYQGDIVESDHDLREEFPEKFMLVDELVVAQGSPFQRQPGETEEQFAERMVKIAERAKAAAATGGEAAEKSKREKNAIAEDDTYTAMTIEELRKHAAEEEIDLGGARTRDQILRVLRSKEMLV